MSSDLLGGKEMALWYAWTCDCHEVTSRETKFVLQFAWLELLVDNT